LELQVLLPVPSEQRHLEPDTLQLPQSTVPSGHKLGGGVGVGGGGIGVGQLGLQAFVGGEQQSPLFAQHHVLPHKYG